MALPLAFFCIKGCYNNWFAVKRNSGLLFKQQEIKLLNSSDHLYLSCNPLIGLFFITHIALKGCILEYGADP